MTQSITIRKVRFPFSGDMPRYWCADDPFLTHFLNALSSTFPALSPSL